MNRLAQLERPPANLPGGILPTALPVPDSNLEALRVEWNRGRDTGSPAALAFALRLKPLTSDPSSVPNAPVRAAGEFSPGTPGSLLTSQSGNESDAGSQGSNQDSSGGNHAATRKIILPDLPEKAAHTVAAPAATSLDKEDRLATARPAQEISLQISSDGDRKVDVRLVERAGEVHVSVRTQDVSLAHELRQPLSGLFLVCAAIGGTILVIQFLLLLLGKCCKT